MPALHGTPDETEAGCYRMWENATLSPEAPAIAEEK
jgi:hypothetical protein